MLVKKKVLRERRKAKATPEVVEVKKTKKRATKKKEAE
jgi:hypothetical protein